MGKVIALANQKGGVGKTATAFNLGFALNHLGYHVLIVDSDPQASLSKNLVEDMSRVKYPLTELTSIYLKDVPFPDHSEYVITGKVVDCIPVTLDLARYELEVNTTLGGEKILSEILEPIRDIYDYILVDTGPALGIFLLGALTACDSVIIPMSPEKYPAEGLNALLATINRVQRKSNPKIKVEGILFTQCKQDTNLHKDYMAQIREICTDVVPVFRTIIPSTIRVSESIAYNQSIIDYEPGHRAAQAYLELAGEVIKNA